MSIAEQKPNVKSHTVDKQKKANVSYICWLFIAVERMLDILYRIYRAVPEHMRSLHFVVESPRRVPLKTIQMEQPLYGLDIRCTLYLPGESSFIPLYFVPPSIMKMVENTSMTKLSFIITDSKKNMDRVLYLT